MNPLRRLRALPFSLSLGLSLLLAACGEQTLYARLDERQANDMVAALRLAGVPAQKLAREIGFEVLTDEADFPRAVQILKAQGLPREDYDSLGKVFKREGFVSTPVEERARLMHALSQELSHTLTSIDGVLQARVTLVVPERHPLSDKLRPASASVMIKHRPGLQVDALLPKVRALVVNSVEGLPYDSVSVVAFAAEASPAAVLPPAQPLGVPLALAITLGVASLGGAGVLAWRRRRQQGGAALALEAAGHD
ncbi:type III secretion system inner membrane ring lipoprotein SctJ [Aquabacterium sp. OR-4]|uniref:type III secretion system inner membrane ring lipoprotein SctJ n=1 Tax=Aquabacterium sp. OR-4 TaxID=2978127 RepID=UPI0021B45969|nr:type III secretion inner membrane ring lipoprotein SctJ [Aquabacterium sp. OR-4]MDT7837971.1 type III secretion inner membrane ring lipoprotein SctJ [Aquabacterium sp. OR-4]